MGLIHLIDATPEIARRRGILPPGTLLEVWPDLAEPGAAWIDDEAKQLLDSAGPPVPSRLSVDGGWVRIYYGPRLRDMGSLPREDSLRTRVLSARGVAAAWVTIDEQGQRATHESEDAGDPTFYLRRPRGDAAHLWRLFRTKADAVAFMGAHFAGDPEGRQWALDLPVGDYQTLIECAATGGRGPGAPA